MSQELSQDFVIDVGAGVGDTPDYVSFTQLSMVERCPQQYEYRYIFGLVEPPAMAPNQGTVLHDVVAVQHDHKIKTKKNLSTSDIEDEFNDRWKKGFRVGWSRGKDASFEPWKSIETSKAALDTARRITHASVVTYHEDQATKMKPLAAELEYKLPFLGGKMYVGYVDCIDGREKKTKAVDMKLVGRRYAPDAAKSSMQLASYAWAHYASTDELFDGVAFHCIIKKGSPEIQVLDSPMTKLRIQAFLVWAQEQMFVIERARFVGHVGLHCNWCGYRHRCPWIKGKGFKKLSVPVVTRLSVSARKKKK